MREVILNIFLWGTVAGFAWLAFSAIRNITWPWFKRSIKPKLDKNGTTCFFIGHDMWTEPIDLTHGARYVLVASELNLVCRRCGTTTKMGC